MSLHPLRMLPSPFPPSGKNVPPLDQTFIAFYGNLAEISPTSHPLDPFLYPPLLILGQLRRQTMVQIATIPPLKLEDLFTIIPTAVKNYLNLRPEQGTVSTTASSQGFLPFANLPP